MHMHGDAIWHFDHNMHPACYVCCEQHAKKHAHVYAFQLYFVCRLLKAVHGSYAKLSGATVVSFLEGSVALYSNQ